MESPVSFSSNPGRLLLRTAELSDAPSMLTRATDAETTRYLPHIRNKTHTVATCEDWVKRCQTEPSSLFLMVVLSSTGEVIGEGGFEGLDVVNKTGDVGVMLTNRPDVIGHGYAVEAMRALVQYGFDELALRTVTVGTLADNAPMRGVMERKFGLMPEMKTLESGGQTCTYTITKESWIGTRSD